MAAEPGRRLRFHWLLDDEKTTVDIRLAPSAGGTALVERWWGYAPEIEPRVGGKVTFGADGEVSAWEPNRVFAYTEDGMTTRWELAESAGETRLTFTQSGFGPNELDDAAQHEAGWRAGLLELKRMHELGEAWAPLIRELPE